MTADSRTEVEVGIAEAIVAIRLEIKLCTISSEWLLELERILGLDG